MIILEPNTNHVEPYIGVPHQVHITYKPIPKLATLKNQYGKTRVSRLFDGRAFTPHASCAKISSRAMDRLCLILPQPSLGECWDAEILIKQGLEPNLRNNLAPNGYRPATERELFHYVKIHPVQQLVALGSTAVLDGSRYSAAFSSGEGRAMLTHRYVREITRNGEYYLFIAI